MTILTLTNNTPYNGGHELFEYDTERHTLLITGYDANGTFLDETYLVNVTDAYARDLGFNV